MLAVGRQIHPRSGPKTTRLRPVVDHVWTVLCSLSSVDEQTRAVSLFNVVEQITITEPAVALKERLEKRANVPIQMELWSWWTRADFEKAETAIARYSLVGPGGVQLPPKLLRIALEEYTTAHTRLRISGFPFMGFGIYWWVIERQGVGDAWEKVARFPMELTYVQPISSPNVPEPPAEPPPSAAQESSSQPAPSRPSRRRVSRAPRRRGSS
jgi:hypothetical protein